MRKLNLMQAKTEAYREEMERNPDLIMIGEEIGEMGGAYGEFPGFLEKYGPDRVINAPDAEAGQTGFAVGAAAAGNHVLLEYMMGDFSIWGFDGIINQAAKQRYCSAGQFSFPIVFLITQGPTGGFGPQHSQMVDGYLQNVPGLKVYCPTFPGDFKGLMKQALRSKDPVAFMQVKSLGIQGEVPDLDVDYVLQPGVANILRPGKDVTLVSYHNGLFDCLKAAEELAAKGIEAEVIDIRTIKPLDEKTILASVEKTGHAIVYTQAPKLGAFTNQICATIAEKAFDALKAPVIHIGAKDFPMPYGGPGEQAVLPHPEDIVEAAVRICK